MSHSAVAPPCWWATALLLMLRAWPSSAHTASPPSSAHTAGPTSSTHNTGPPQPCLRTADILSCSGLFLQQLPAQMPTTSVTLDLSYNRLELLEAGSFAGLVRLQTLRLAHNQLKAMQPGTFQNSSGVLLRHLDLSSNQLQWVEQHYFLELPGLEELLLFNNRIVRVERAALATLTNLRKVYVSHNRLTDFPFASVRNRSHPRLSLLDLSSNQLPSLPLQDISALPPALQRGLFLHNNSLHCDCSMYGLFRSWERRRFASVTQFRADHVCLLYGIQRGGVRFFLHRRYFRHCEVPQAEQESSVAVEAGKPLLLHCVTPLSGGGVTFHWVAPNGEYVAPPGNNQSLRVFVNGSLEMKAAQEQDSGIYWCLALDGQRKETWEVNVTVVKGDGTAAAAEVFNTGYTTLLGCVVSLVLVLMYLYLTPCRCRLRSQAPPPAGEAGAGGGASILTPTTPGATDGPGRKVSTNRHVAFLEPIREQNGRLGAGPMLGAGQQAPRQQRAGGETDSMVSVFSDTPIIFP